MEAHDGRNTIFNMNIRRPWNYDQCIYYRSNKGLSLNTIYDPDNEPLFPVLHLPTLTGYGQDLSGFGHTFADPSQQTASYGAPTAQPAVGPQAAAAVFARVQNHNVTGFHPYRRWASPTATALSSKVREMCSGDKQNWISGLMFFGTQIHTIWEKVNS
jgi:hypothetical protein